MWLKNVRYLDYNAGSGLSDLVRKKLGSLLKDEVDGGLFWANPSSRHRLGQRINHYLYQAKVSVAKSLGENIAIDDLFFTSSGTEANQTVIRSAVVGLGRVEQLSLQAQGAILGAAEHSATLDLLPQLDDFLPYVRILPTLSNGQYDLGALEILLNEASEEGVEKIFISLSWANNETGVIQDLEALKAVIKRSPIGVILHLDAAQVWGKWAVDLSQSGADYVTFSAHKIGALPGTGVVWKKPGAPFTSLILGSQQGGHRGGTENTLGIIATGVAAQAIDVAHFDAHTRALRDRLEEKLKALRIRTRIWGTESPRIGNTSRIGLIGFQKYENWVELLDLRGFAVSHASACKSQVIEPSKVLLAMGATKQEAINSIRVSLGPHNTIEDIDQFVDTLQDIMQLKVSSLEDKL